ncbi:MAG: TIGR03016 family PEP-CTERM system-associated outer membrane protein [Deltaproteobacteria bacterium]
MLVAAACSLADAQTWRISPTFSFESTLTDNVNLAPSDQRKSDWVNEFRPGVRFTEVGAHSKLAGSISVPMLVYARTGGENNYATPNVAISGTYEAIERFFFIDATANVSPQFLSPFGTRSSSLANASANRYTSQSYTISPYIRGGDSNYVNYELRQQSIWSDASGISTGSSTNRSYTSNVNGYVTRQPLPAGATLEYHRSDIRFSDIANAGSNSETTEIARLRGLYQFDPAFRVSGSVGYENNQFFFTEERGTTYGAGFVWHPTDRTNLNATYEHRFFGASYNVAFDHRTPLSVWSIAASRDITSYPQQIAGLPAGDVDTLLNALFSSRVPDPGQRQSLVDQLIRDRGLPSQLSGPLAIYAQQITLVEQARATFGILGARNSIFFSAYHTRNEPAARTDEALAPLIPLLSNTTQNGFNVAWNHQLAPTLTLSANGDASRTTDNTATGVSTRFYTVKATLSRVLSALTSAYAGARYQRSLSDSDFAANYSEFAVFVGFTHTFH